MYAIRSYYELKIFVHHEAIQGNNEGEDAIIHGIFRYDYVQKKTLFLNGVFHDIGTKRKFIALFPDQKKTVNKKLGSFSTRFEFLTANQLLETVKLVTN